MQKFLFILLNIILSSNLLKYPVFFIIFIMIGTEYFPWPRFLFGNQFTVFLIILGVPLLAIFIFWLLKIFIFIIFYNKSKKGAYLYCFFKRYKNDEKYRENILIRAMFSDVAFFTVEALVLYSTAFYSDTLYSKTFIDYMGSAAFICLLCGTGVLLSYLSLAAWLNRQKSL